MGLVLELGWGRAFEIPVSAPKDPMALPPDQLQ